MAKTILNLVLFKAGWVACILFAAEGFHALSIASVAVVVTAHLIAQPVARKEALFLLCASAIGLLWESTLVWSGLLVYPGAENAALAPLWIVAMWTLFATTINHGLSWVKRWWVYGAVAGGVGGPLAFYAGASAGAVVFTNTWLALAVIGAGWAVLLPAVALLADTIIDSTFMEPVSDEIERDSRRSTLLREIEYHA